MKILIADDHSIVRKGLRMILSEAYPHAYIEEVADSTELLAWAVKDDWDVIISDISMPGRSGAEIIPVLKRLVPKTPILMLSTHPAEQYAVRAIKAGASSYLTKESAPEELVKAVEHLLTGRKYITAEVAELLAESAGDDFGKAIHESLSDREFEVLKLIAGGKTIAEIADVLAISANTVSTYRARILEKMHFNSNAGLIKYAVGHNLL